MTPQDVFQSIRAKAAGAGVDPDLAVAIATVESNGNPWAVRFEPEFKWFIDIDKHAQASGVSRSTEATLQAISYGPMQIMGAAARELGFTGPLILLAGSALGIDYAVKKLAWICKRYPQVNDAISAYNAGMPKHQSDGRYVNQAYVDAVTARMGKLKRIGLNVMSAPEIPPVA